MNTNFINLNHWMLPTRESPQGPRPSPMPLEITQSEKEMRVSFSSEGFPALPTHSSFRVGLGVFSPSLTPQAPVVVNTPALIQAGAQAFASQSAGDEERKENLEEFLREEEMDPFLRSMKVELSLEM